MDLDDRQRRNLGARGLAAGPPPAPAAGPERRSARDVIGPAGRAGGN